MNEFEVKGHDGFLKITFQEVFGFPNETSSWGGYDTKSFLEINTDDFKVKATFYVSTGEIFEFYKKLSECNEELKGRVHFVSYEGNLEFDIQYDINGHISVKGNFSKQNEMSNKLVFHIISDQTYVQSTLQQLKIIVERYGDLKGVR